MSYIRAGRGWAIAAAAAILIAPLGLAGLSGQGEGQQPATRTATAATGWSSQVWAAASRGDSGALLELLSDNGAARHAESFVLLQNNEQARESRRAEESTKVRQRLEVALADHTDLGIADALKTAVELSMLSPDKDAVLQEEPIKELVRRAERAAAAAEERRDWLAASELYFRLSLLYDDRKTEYKENYKRENQRLAMIRLYAPERLWEIRNQRRNAELDRQAKLQAQGAALEEEEDESDPAAQAERRPLPPYNPMGDDYRQKLTGIEENMVLNSLGRAHERHVERKGMHEMLLGALDALRTLVTTSDLEHVFPGIADEQARGEFLGFIESEEARLSRIGPRASRADLLSVLDRVVSRNQQTVAVPKMALLHEFGNGAMAALDDFSAIVWPDEIRRFNRNTQGRFIGVGIQIELDPLANIRVVTPLEGTPAQQAGVRPGDLIKKVNGTSTVGFTLEQAVDVITGPENTQVVLTIEREVDEDVREIEFNLRRAVIPIYTVKGWKRLGPREDAWEWFIDGENRIGYIRLTGFNERTDQEFDRALEQMKGLNGLILDLRHNPGGLLEQAVEITSRFIDRDRTRNYGGMVVTTHDKDNRLMQQERAHRGKARLANVPVVVLVNEGSASASEIVAGALQDYARAGDARALILGRRSFGKGSVQNVWQFDKPAPAAVKVTTQYYLLPRGRKIHRVDGAETWGVEPDLEVEMLPGQIAEAFQLRQAADVIKLDQNGERAADADAPDPDDLILKGIDLQLHTALVILQSQAPASPTGPRLVDRPTP
jgi:carboxyl-terminal processing protease